MSAIGTHWDSNSLLEDQTSKFNKYVVKKSSMAVLSYSVYVLLDSVLVFTK